MECARANGQGDGRPAAGIVVAFLTAICAGAVFLPALRNGFVNWDDNLYVYQNPFVRHLDATLLYRAFLGFTASNWHPATWISHALDFAVWGSDPFGHHLTSVLLHAANTFLAVLLVIRLGRPAGRPILLAAGLTGLLFGLHPLRVESVAWVSERKDVLCGFFFLLSLHAYVSYAAGAAARGEARAASRALGDRRYLAALGLFALALMSKPMAVSLPAVLLLLDWHPLGRVGDRRALGAAALEKLPFFALALASSVLTVLAQRTADAIVPFERIGLAERTIVAVRSLGLYVAKMALPVHLVPYYAYPHGRELLSADTLLGVSLAIAAGAATVIAARRGNRLWPALCCWYALTVAPVLGIVQVGGQAMADRYSYLPGLAPSAGAAAGLAWAWRRLASRPTGRVLLAAAVASLLAAFAALSVRQVGVWKDSLTLWTSIIEREPAPQAFAHYNRAIALEASGRTAEALADYGRAVSLDPENPRFLVNRGLLLLQVGRKAAARADLEAACRLGNDFSCQVLRFNRAAAPAVRP